MTADAWWCCPPPVPSGRIAMTMSGPDRPDQPDVVAEDLLPAPLLERLVDAERVAEVHGAREVLLGAVELRAPRAAPRCAAPRARRTAPARSRSGRRRRAWRVTTTVRTPWPQPIAASIALFSSSGCAVACISTAGGLQLAQQQPEAHLAPHPGDGRHLRARRAVCDDSGGQQDREHDSTPCHGGFLVYEG